jgi:hypothetical protein
MGPIPCPPRLPDLNRLDYYFWGYVKEHFYFAPQLRTVNELKDCISETITSVNGDKFEEFEYRLDVCYVTRGAHMENLNF